MRPMEVGGGAWGGEGWGGGGGWRLHLKSYL